LVQFTIYHQDIRDEHAMQTTFTRQSPTQTSPSSSGAAPRTKHMLA
jgi:hypothetical protein